MTNLKFILNVSSFLCFSSVEIKSDVGYQVGRRISSDNHRTILNSPDQFYPMRVRRNYSVLVQGRGVPRL